MRKFRIVEITEKYMNGDSFIALTNATDEAITKAVRLWYDGGLEELSRFYFFKELLFSDETCHYDEMKSLFDIDKVYLIY